MDVSDFIAADPIASDVLEWLTETLLDWEDVERTDQKSQIKFARKHPFAALWVPEQYFKGKLAPAVVSIFARHRIDTIRFRDVVEPRKNRFTHHFDVHSVDDLDAEVLDWLRAAWKDAGWATVRDSPHAF